MRPDIKKTPCLLHHWHVALSTAEQIVLMQWWLEKRRPHKPETLAQALHRLQRAAIRDAFGLQEAK